MKKQTGGGASLPESAAQAAVASSAVTDKQLAAGRSTEQKGTSASGSAQPVPPPSVADAAAAKVASKEPATAAVSASAAAGNGKSRRGPWFGVALTLGVLAALVLLPLLGAWIYLGGGFFADTVKGRLEKALDAPVTLESVTAGGGGVELRGLRVASHGADKAAGAGKPVAGDLVAPAFSLESARIAWDFWALLADRRIREAVLEKPELRLERKADGSWNFSPRPSGEKGAFRIERFTVRHGLFSVAWAERPPLVLNELGGFFVGLRRGERAPVFLKGRWPSGAPLELRGSFYHDPGKSGWTGTLGGEADLAKDLASLWPADAPVRGRLSRGELFLDYSTTAADAYTLSFDGRFHFSGLAVPFFRRRKLTVTEGEAAASGGMSGEKTAGGATRLTFKRPLLRFGAVGSLGADEVVSSCDDRSSRWQATNVHGRLVTGALADALTPPPTAAVPLSAAAKRRRFLSLGPEVSLRGASFTWRNTPSSFQLAGAEILLGPNGAVGRLKISAAPKIKNEKTTAAAVVFAPALVRVLRGLRVDDFLLDLERLSGLKIARAALAVPGGLDAPRRLEPAASPLLSSRNGRKKAAGANNAAKRKAPAGEFGPLLRGRIFGKNLPLRVEKLPEQRISEAIEVLPAWVVVLKGLAFDGVELLRLPRSVSPEMLPGSVPRRFWQGNVVLRAELDARGRLAALRAEVETNDSGKTPMRARFSVRLERKAHGGGLRLSRVTIKEATIPGRELAAWLNLAEPRFHFAGEVVLRNVVFRPESGTLSGTARLQRLTCAAAGFGFLDLNGALNFSRTPAGLTVRLNLDSWRQTTPVVVSPPLPRLRAEAFWPAENEVAARPVKITVAWGTRVAERKTGAGTAAQASTNAAPVGGFLSAVLNYRPAAADRLGNVKGKIVTDLLDGKARPFDCELLWNPHVGRFGPLTVRLSRLPAEAVRRVLLRHGVKTAEHLRFFGVLRDLELTLKAVSWKEARKTEDKVARVRRLLKRTVQPETFLSWFLRGTATRAGVFDSVSACGLLDACGDFRFIFEGADPDVGGGPRASPSVALRLFPTEYRLRLGPELVFLSPEFLSAAKKKNEAAKEEAEVEPAELFLRWRSTERAAGLAFRLDRLLLNVPDVLRAEASGWGELEHKRGGVKRSPAERLSGEFSWKFSCRDLRKIHRRLRLLPVEAPGSGRALPWKVSGGLSAEGRFAWRPNPQTAAAAAGRGGWALSGRLSFFNTSVAGVGKFAPRATGLRGTLPLIMERGGLPLEWNRRATGTVRIASAAWGALQLKNAALALTAFPNGLRQNDEVRVRLPGGRARVWNLVVRGAAGVPTEAEFEAELEALDLGVCAAQLPRQLNGLTGAVLSGRLRKCRLRKIPSPAERWDFSARGALSATLFGGQLRADRFSVRDVFGKEPLFGTRLRLTNADLGEFTRPNPAFGLLAARFDLVLDDLRTTSFAPSGFRSFRLFCRTVNDRKDREQFDGVFALWAVRETALKHARASGVSEKWLRNRRFGIEKIAFEAELRDGAVTVKPLLKDKNGKHLLLKGRGLFGMDFKPESSAPLKWAEVLRVMRRPWRRLPPQAKPADIIERETGGGR